MIVNMGGALVSEELREAEWNAFFENWNETVTKSPEASGEQVPNKLADDDENGDASGNDERKPG
jgi:hypothetical protein